MLGERKFKFLRSTVESPTMEVPKNMVAFKANRKEEGETMLIDFVWAHKDLVDKDVSDRFFRGDKSAITDALNQIHWKSLRERGRLNWKQKEKISVGSINREVRYLNVLIVNDKLGYEQNTKEVRK